MASPGAKALGAAILLIFTPALLALLPWHLRWLHAVAIEGLLGRIVGDVLLHYFNTVGAYIVCGAVVAVALYLSTAFSFVEPADLAEHALCLCVCSVAALPGLARRSGRSRGTRRKRRKKLADEAAALRNAQ